MRYLNFELYNKICFENNSRDIREWKRQYELWLKEFGSFSENLPDSFVKAFEKKHFRGFNVCDIEIRSNSEENLYTLNMTLREKNVRHYLKFSGVSFMKTELEILESTGAEWHVCEIGRVKENVNFIAILLSGGEFEFRFTELEYTNTK